MQRVAPAAVVGQILFAAVFLFALTLNAQETESPSPAEGVEPAVPSVTVSTAELASRADEINADLLGVLNSLQIFDERVQAIPDARKQLLADLNEVLAGLGEDEFDSISLSDAESLQQTLLRMSKQLADWRSQLQARVGELEAERTGLRENQAFLEKRLAEDEDAGVPDSLRARVDELIIQLAATRQVLSGRTSVVLEELAAISDTELRISSAQKQVTAVLARGPSQLLEFDERPLWQALESGQLFADGFARGLENRRRSTLEFLRAREGSTLNFVGGLVLLLLAALAFRFSSLHRHSDEGEKPAGLFDRRPFSVIVLFWSVLGFELFLEPVPAAIGLARVILVVTALLRLAPLVLGDRTRAVGIFILMLGLAAVLVEVVGNEGLVQRILTISIGTAGAFGFVRLRQRLPQSVDSLDQLWLTVSRVIAWTAPYTLGAGVLALVVGLSALGSQLVVGTLLLLMALLGILVLEKVLIEFADTIVDVGGDRGFRSVAIAPARVKTQLRFFIRLFMLVLLISLLSNIFPVIDRSWALIRSFLSRDMSVGTVQFSVYDILVLLLSLFVAVVAARVIRVLLNEDVLPRFSVRPGAAEAASRLVYYGLVTLGVLFALAAAGVELSRLTLVISALGVGIGFGLQGIVNNFVSGVILSFERPIQVGDTIVVGNLTGRVTQIGLRATRIRTFDAAEVIVPNADLISGNVVNWTLSDRTRRLDLPVFVAYGSDLNKVREALMGVAANHPAIAAAPAPEVLFQAYRDSALELWLRLWMPDSGNWPTVRSELYYAIDEALRAAEIEVPFPQRVLHFEEDGSAPVGGPAAAD